MRKIFYFSLVFKIEEVKRVFVDEEIWLESIHTIYIILFYSSPTQKIERKRRILILFSVKLREKKSSWVFSTISCFRVCGCRCLHFVSNFNFYSKEFFVTKIISRRKFLQQENLKKNPKCLKVSVTEFYVLLCWLSKNIYVELFFIDLLITVRWVKISLDKNLQTSTFKSFQTACEWNFSKNFNNHSRLIINACAIRSRVRETKLREQQIILVMCWGMEMKIYWKKKYFYEDSAHKG